ncbi:anaerobic ribonucleoside-triphosphate reductase [Anaerofustis sp.]|uniref:anaerobic ribonucleoside-triphosphate reductase n=1 Tax=Anaerofustis sp. TaxID=1872517 RepID=UPI0025BDE702|nr:anaerobic ribonucleoside-triphosphate reductase [Anaerofustis sp.]
MNTAKELTYETKIDNTNVYVYGKIENLTKEEIKAYIKEVEKEKNSEVTELNLYADEESGYIGRSAKVKPIPFDRIRRITGYLVGTLDRFNDAKRAEESERVKHSMNSEMETL